MAVPYRTMPDQSLTKRLLQRGFFQFGNLQYNGGKADSSSLIHVNGVEEESFPTTLCGGAVWGSDELAWNGPDLVAGGACRRLLDPANKGGAR